MKTLAITTMVLLLIGSSTSCQSQVEVDRTRFPNITEDLTFEDPLNIFGKHVITLDGAWGLGLQATYLKKNLLYASVEAGYSWVITNHGRYPQEDFKSKKFRPWFHLRAGYPVFTFTKGTTSKYVTGHSYNNKGDEIEHYYQIKAPTHVTLIPEVGYCINPHPVRISTLDNGNYATWTSFLAHTVNAGLRVRFLSKTKVTILDSKTQNRTNGSTYRFGEIYFGAVIPTKDFVKRPHPQYNDIGKTQGGYQVIFRIPTKHNGLATFDIGIRATGYSKTARGPVGEPGEATYQLVIGNSLFGSAD